MASLRGWARSASTAAKLASVEQIIGYRFKSVERLYEALDIDKPILKLKNGEERLGKRTRNTRLALVGDSAAELNFACQWYERNLEGYEWVIVRTQGLRNDTLGQLGFKLGLDKLTVPDTCEGSYAMASTVEAILGAVHFDGGNQALSRVMTRLGVTHKLLDPPERAWVHEPVISGRNLPPSFFSGHQWDMQGLLMRTNPRLLPRSATGEVIALPLNEASLLLEAKRARLRAKRLAEEQHKVAAELQAENEAKLKAEEEAKLKEEQKVKLREEKDAKEARLKAEKEAELQKQETGHKLWEIFATTAQERARKEEQDEAPKRVVEEAEGGVQKEAEREAQEQAHWEAEEAEETDLEAQQQAEQQAQWDAEDAAMDAEDQAQWEAEQADLEAALEAQEQAWEDLERSEKPQPTGLWDGMKQWWLGPGAVTHPSPAAESKKKKKAKSKKNAKSADPTDGIAPAWWDRLWHAEQASKSAKDPKLAMAPVPMPKGKKKRKRVLQNLTSQMTSLKKQKAKLVSGKTQHSRKKPGSAGYKHALESLETRLQAARHTYQEVLKHASEMESEAKARSRADRED